MASWSNDVDDVLLGTKIVRLSLQYDASDFLQACPHSEQYSVLASIYGSESRYLLQQQQPEQENHAEENENGEQWNDETMKDHLLEDVGDGIPSICYATRVMAFTTSTGRKDTPLHVMRREQERIQNGEEEDEGEMERNLQVEETANEEKDGKKKKALRNVSAAKTRATVGEAAGEVLYNEEGGYYYDEKGYYDEDGNYYYFEATEETGEAEEFEVEPAEMDLSCKNHANHTVAEIHANARTTTATVAEANRENRDTSEGIETAWDSSEPFTHHSNEVPRAPRYERSRPTNPQWSKAPFLAGICPIDRAAALLEGALPPVDVFLRSIGAVPSFPLRANATHRVEGSENAMASVESSGFHVLASQRHLHIVYVPPQGASGNTATFTAQEEETTAGNAEEEWDTSLSEPAGVLLSIPLGTPSGTVWASNWGCTASYGRIGNGLMLLEVYAAPHMVNHDTESEGITLSMIFGVPQDSSFRSVSCADTLLHCFERRVVQHLVRNGAKQDETFAEVMAKTLDHDHNTDNNRDIHLRIPHGHNVVEYEDCATLTQPNASDSQPLFTYSAALMLSDNTEKLVYDAASHSLLLPRERVEAERLARERIDALYLARNMEPPSQRYLREAIAILARKETENRAALQSDALAPYASTFRHILRVQFPLLTTQSEALVHLIVDEARKWTKLYNAFTEKLQQLSAQETRRRLEEQFDFERRLRALQCSVGFDTLIEHERAARALIERDASNEWVMGGIMDAWIRLTVAQHLAAAHPQKTETPNKDDGLVALVAPATEWTPLHSGHSHAASARSASSASVWPTTDAFMRVVAGRASRDRGASSDRPLAVTQPDALHGSGKKGQQRSKLMTR